MSVPFRDDESNPKLEEGLYEDFGMLESGREEDGSEPERSVERQLVLSSRDASKSIREEGTHEMNTTDLSSD